ncbi:hypothetical protein OURE66S_02040 [Oligella ureolytica]
MKYSAALLLEIGTAGFPVVIRQTSLMAKALDVKGLMNVQFAIQNADVYVL